MLFFMSDSDGCLVDETNMWRLIATFELEKVHIVHI